MTDRKIEIVHSARRSEFSSGMGSIARTLFRYRSLTATLVRKELATRFVGSVFGLLWFVITPAIQIAIYTLVFGTVFQARMPFRAAAESSQQEFGVYLFSGLLIFGLLADVISRSPSLIVTNPNFVKKVIFPIEILPVVAVLSALVSAGISFLLLVAALLLIMGSIPPFILLYPFCVLIMVPMLLGLSWFMAALGAFVRDIAQVVGLALTVLMFISPIFSPITAFPPWLQTFILFNPISLPIEFAHQVLFLNQLPEPVAVAGYLLVSVVVMAVGWRFFQKTRGGFADVL
ncbi:ABC transporter permease [Azospirillum brasilense]|nr:ABC transporter permease [Azospirillum brasilense]